MKHGSEMRQEAQLAAARRCLPWLALPTLRQSPSPGSGLPLQAAGGPKHGLGFSCVVV